MGGSPVPGARFGAPNPGPVQRPKIDPKSTPILLVMLAFWAVFRPACESVGSGQIAISANQIHSQNDTLILGHFSARRAKQNGRHALSPARPEVGPKRAILGPKSRPAPLSQRPVWVPQTEALSCTAGLESRIWVPKIGRPKADQIDGRGATHLWADPPNQGPIWGPKSRSGPKAQNRPQIDPNPACNACFLGRF